MRIDELRFLVAEDHGFQRWALGNILAGLGAQHIAFAEDGSAALEAFRSAEPPIDIVISDLCMPGMDGMELLRRLGQARSDASVILTSSLDPALMGSVQAMAKAYGLRVIATVEKPATARSLMSAIENHAREPEAHADADARAHPVFAVPPLAQAVPNEQVEVLFQPRLDPAGGEICSAQAVGHWRHPVHGFLPHDRIVSALKSGGFSGGFTRVVIRKAFCAYQQLREAGCDIAMCIDVDQESLVDLAFAETVHALAVARQVEPRHITFHLDEPPRAPGTGTVLENLSRLRMLGFNVARQLGPGCAQSEHFASLACNELRVDQATVREAAIDPAQRTWLVAALMTARAGGATLGVDGIETHTDWELALPLGFDWAQGAGICPPRAVRELEDLIRRPARQAAGGSRTC